MTTITVDTNIQLPKNNFSSVEELYLALQQQLSFEIHLQNKAKQAMQIDEKDLVDF
ncbi:MAG: hypothetical protein H6767_00330 [Candidatus Peribacteria bacterium]|nr:MAG: hypothetical protein H6767_00330 [Candidatus Peribacteria bacterium]